MKANEEACSTLRQRNCSAGSARPAFISGPILCVLFLCLSVSLTLGEALGHAAAGNRRRMDSLKAYLAFEETLLRLDLKMGTEPFAMGDFTIVTEERADPAGSPGILVRFMDGSRVLEETWLKRKD